MKMLICLSSSIELTIWSAGSVNSVVLFRNQPPPSLALIADPRVLPGEAHSFRGLKGSRTVNVGTVEVEIQGNFDE